jgi:hypothetical protein
MKTPSDIVHVLFLAVRLDLYARLRFAEISLHHLQRIEAGAEVGEKQDNRLETT